jgi:hypothetical protein
MKILSLFGVVLISGCSLIVPVKHYFPDAPDILKERCENLMIIEGTGVSIADMLKTVVNNYALYYECSVKVDGWNEWYEEQKRIFESVK